MLRFASVVAPPPSLGPFESFLFLIGSREALGAGQHLCSVPCWNRCEEMLTAGAEYVQER
jgi:hypothetical protein